jgi:hypothetical protein
MWELENAAEGVDWPERTRFAVFADYDAGYADISASSLAGSGRMTATVKTGHRSMRSSPRHRP